MSAKILRQKYMRQFAGMTKYTRISSWLILAGYIVQAALAVALGTFVLGLDNLAVQIPSLAIILIFIGTRLRGLNNIIHECSHATFSVVRSDNVLIGKICSAILFGSFMDYRDEHLSHHAHIGDYEHDLDLQGIEELRIHETLTPRVVLRHLTNPLLGRHLPYYFSLNLRARDGRVFQLAKFAILGAVAIATVFAPVSTLLLVVFAYAFVYSSLCYWADCMDHAGLFPSEDDLYSSRNILARGLIKWLFFPRNDCFHLVHHLFPQVPARHLAETHDILMSEDVYRKQPNAVRGLGEEIQPPAMAAE